MHFIVGDTELIDCRLQDLKAKQTMLATLHGIVMGHYSPTERFGAATVKGATKVFVNPASNKIHSTVVATIGPASAAMVRNYGSTIFLLALV